MSLQMSQFCPFFCCLCHDLFGWNFHSHHWGSSSTSHAGLAIGPSPNTHPSNVCLPTPEVGIWNWVCLSWVGVESTRTALGNEVHRAISSQLGESPGPDNLGVLSVGGAREAEQKEASVNGDQ